MVGIYSLRIYTVHSELGVNLIVCVVLVIDFGLLYHVMVLYHWKPSACKLTTFGVTSGTYYNCKCTITRLISWSVNYSVYQVQCNHAAAYVCMYIQYSVVVVVCASCS